MSLSIEHAYLLGMVLAAVFYGVFVVLYLGVLYIIFFVRKESQSKKSAAFIIVTVMMIVATLHLAISFVRTRTALVDKAGEPDGALNYLNLTSIGSYMFQDTLYAFQTLLGDSFIVYRLYVVYAGDKRVVVPACVVFAGSTGVTIVTLVLESLAKPGSSLFTLNKWITTFVVFTFVTNLTCTGMIAYKLWSVERQVYRAKSNRYLTRIAITVVESGALYSTFLVSLLITYVKADWTLYIPFLMLVHVIGIAFSLVLIRVGLGLSFGDTSAGTIGTVSDVKFRSTAVSKHGQSTRGQRSSFGMVRVTRVTETENYDCDTTFESNATIQKAVELDYDRRSHSSISGRETDGKVPTAC